MEKTRRGVIVINQTGMKLHVYGVSYKNEWTDLGEIAIGATPFIPSSRSSIKLVFEGDGGYRRMIQRDFSPNGEKVLKVPVTL